MASTHCPWLCGLWHRRFSGLSVVNIFVMGPSMPSSRLNEAHTLAKSSSADGLGAGTRPCPALAQAGCVIGGHPTPCPCGPRTRHPPRPTAPGGRGARLAALPGPLGAGPGARPSTAACPPAVARVGAWPGKGRHRLARVPGTDNGLSVFPPTGRPPPPRFLCLKNKSSASVVFTTYTQKHPSIEGGPPFVQPLLNFLWFLLLAVDG